MTFRRTEVWRRYRSQGIEVFVVAVAGLSDIFPLKRGLKNHGQLWSILLLYICDGLASGEPASTDEA